MKVAFQVDNSVCERKPTIEYNGEVYPWTVNQTYVRAIDVITIILLHLHTMNSKLA